MNNHEYRHRLLPREQIQHHYHHHQAYDGYGQQVQSLSYDTAPSYAIPVAREPEQEGVFRQTVREQDELFYRTFPDARLERDRRLRELGIIRQSDDLYHSDASSPNETFVQDSYHPGDSNSLSAAIESPINHAQPSAHNHSFDSHSFPSHAHYQDEDCHHDHAENHSSPVTPVPITPTDENFDVDQMLTIQQAVEQSPPFQRYQRPVAVNDVVVQANCIVPSQAPLIERLRASEQSRLSISSNGVSHPHFASASTSSGTMAPAQPFPFAFQARLGHFFHPPSPPPMDYLPPPQSDPYRYSGPMTTSTTAAAVAVGEGSSLTSYGRRTYAGPGRPRKLSISIPGNPRKDEPSPSTSGSRKRPRSSVGEEIMNGIDGSPPQKPKIERKIPRLACFFCRGRKIACGPPPPGSEDTKSCNQCQRRNLKCDFPTESRRGMRSKKGGAEGSGDDGSASPSSPASPQSDGIPGRNVYPIVGPSSSYTSSLAAALDAPVAGPSSAPEDVKDSTGDTDVPAHSHPPPKKRGRRKKSEMPPTV